MVDAVFVADEVEVVVDVGETLGVTEAVRLFENVYEAGYRSISHK